MHEFTKWIREWSNGHSGWLTRFIAKANDLGLFEPPEDESETVVYQFITFQKSRLKSFHDFIDRSQVIQHPYEFLERLMFAIIPDVTRIQTENAASFALAYPVALWLKEHWIALRVLMLYHQQVHDGPANQLLTTRIPFTLYVYESKVFPHMIKLNDHLREESTQLSANNEFHS